MNEKDHLKNTVNAIPIEKKSISSLVRDMSRTGFQGRKLAEVCDVYETMINDEDTTILLGYSASLSVAGQWKIISWLIENGFIDILVPTGANISEDIVEAMGFKYYRGNHVIDDSKLFDAGINRYLDVFGREEDYIKMTELIADFIMTLDENYNYSSREFLALFGRWLGDRGIRSIVTRAAEKGVPIFCPAIADSPYGDAALIAKSRGFSLTIDAMKDYFEFMSLSQHITDSGVFYVGGGVPKDFIQLLSATSNLMYPDRKVPNRDDAISRLGTDETYYPHKYAIQVTTDSPQWGGLSGCTFEEAVSWGKETDKGKYTQCYCDATIALPIMAHVLNERIETARTSRDLSSLLDSAELASEERRR